MSRSKRLALCFGLFLFSGASQAVPITIDSLTAAWIDPVGGGNTVSITGPGSVATIYWGVDAGNGQSGYQFETATTPFTKEVPPATDNFLLGTWTHFNNPIYAPTLDQVTLVLTADMSSDGTDLGSFDFLYDFMHNETPNSANPCANGEANGSGGSGVNINGCADIVDVAFNDLSQSFMVDGARFTLNLVESSTHFETIEKRDNTFAVYANITPVPAPATLFLVGLGLIGLGFVRRLKHN